MDVFTNVIIILCMAVYIFFGIYIIRGFESVVKGIFGTLLVIAGGFGVYFVAPYIAMLLVYIFQIAVALIVLSIIGGILSASE